MVPSVSTLSESENAQVKVVEESDELPLLHIGRIIGKDGQMIRDLQARSGCRIEVDQKNEPGQYSTIFYRGKIDDIVFAKRLVSMLCNKEDGADEYELPLGKAMTKQIQVPKSVIGRIIGRGGEMIKEIQLKSRARVQVDHSSEYNTDANLYLVSIMITGTECSILRAEEMILVLSGNLGQVATAGVNYQHVGAYSAARYYPQFSAVQQWYYYQYYEPYTLQYPLWAEQMYPHY